MNTRFIVVPIDFTEATVNALNYGIALASESGSEVLALHIYDDESQRLEKEAALNEIIDEAEHKENVTVTGRVIEGTIEDDVTKVAQTLKADLVVLGLHWPRPLGKVFGSNTMKIIRDSKVPFLVVNKYVKYEPIKKIGVTIDLEKESVQVVKAAAELALTLNAEVDLIGAHYHNRDSAIGEDVNMTVARNFLERHGVKNSGVLLEGENFMESLIQFSRENNIDVLAATYTPETLEMFSGKFVQNLLENSERIPVLTMEFAEVGVGSNLHFMQ